MTAAKVEFKQLVRKSYALLTMAGVSFVIGLVLLALSGISKFL